MSPPLPATGEEEALASPRGSGGAAVSKSKSLEIQRFVIIYYNLPSGTAVAAAVAEAAGSFLVFSPFLGVPLVGPPLEYWKLGKRVN